MKKKKDKKKKDKKKKDKKKKDKRLGRDSNPGRGVDNP